MKQIQTILIFIIIFFSCLFAPISVNALPAFPGAEGWGSDTIGGRNSGNVVFVTNTNNSGSGSLREACSGGNRIIVFKTGGTIDLDSEISINNPYVTIAGQTAPGGGILIRDYGIRVRTNNVIIRGLRIRIGLNNVNNGNNDCLGIESSSNEPYNIILDHNSMSWSRDETSTIWFAANNITYSWNIFSEALLPHGMSVLFGPGNSYISCHHNLFAHNDDRNPLIGGGNNIQTYLNAASPTEVINNVMYNPGWFAIRYSGHGQNSNDQPQFSHAIGNYQINGTNTPLYIQNANGLRSGHDVLPASRVYGLDNIGYGRPDSSYPEIAAFRVDYTPNFSSSMQFTPSGISTDSSDDILSIILGSSGAIVPSRDSVDLRVVLDVQNGTGAHISDPASVGGYPTIASGTYPNDTDNDGMPDSWETARSLNPNDSSDAFTDRNGDGYVNLEEYINEFFTGSPEPTTPIVPTFNPDTGEYNLPQNVQLTLDSGADNTYYTTDGSEPDNTDTEYIGGTIGISGGDGIMVALKAVSYNEVGRGSVGSALYTFDLTGPDAPTFTPSTGTYNTAQSVVVNEPVDASATYYTSNGTDPDNTNTLYTGAFTVDGSDTEVITVRAVSYDTAGNKGDIGSVVYTFDKTDPPVTDYTPPIGIPDPGLWGTTHPITSDAPARPNPWTTEQAGYYYIDFTSGTDTGRTYGTPSAPRATIPGTLSAGAYVEVHGIDDGSVERYMGGWSGTADNPIWIRGQSSDNKGVIRGNTVIRNADYVIIENIDFNGNNTFTKGGIVIQGADYICVRNSNFRNYLYAGNASGMGISPKAIYSDNNDCHDIILYNCNFEELGEWDYTGSDDPDFHGFQPGGNPSESCYTYNIWVLNSTFYHISGNGVQVTGRTQPADAPFCHNVYVGNNIGSYNRQASFWAKSSTDVIFSQNTAFGGRTHGPQPGTGLGWQYGTNRLWFLYNKTYDNQYGIRQSSTNAGANAWDAYIIGNKIYDCLEYNSTYNQSEDYSPGCGFACTSDNMTKYIIDNTIYNVNRGIASNPGAGAYIIKGNIISEIRDNDYQFHIPGDLASRSLANYNVLYDETHGMRVSWGGSIYNDLGSFFAATNNCDDCIDADPLFTDIDSDDFTLQELSPAIDANIEHDVYQTFYDRYGIDIRVDFNEVSRYQGANWDMGAFEYTGVTDTAPSAPTFSPGTGTYNEAQDVLITPAASADNTYYTTDGSQPDNTDTEYIGGTISISGTDGQTITLRAVSYNELGKGVVGSAIYTFDLPILTPDAPTFSPDTGSYTGQQDVTIIPDIDADNTYYTTDGTDPNNADAEYISGTIAVNGTDGEFVTLKAVSYNEYGKGITGAATYSFYDAPEVPDAPTFDPVGGNYTSAQNVTIIPDVDAQITWYTTDGTDPGSSDTIYYGGTIPISGTDGEVVTLKAISFREHVGFGAIGIAIYTFIMDTVGPDAPTFTPSTGTYAIAQNVVINEASDANTTYYTTNGSQPDSTDIQYFGGSVLIDGDNGQTIILNAVSYDLASNKGIVGSTAYTFDKDIIPEGDFEAPIGIPDPGLVWTIDPIDTVTPDRLDPWTTEQVDFYYINFETGNDTGNTYGTPSNPRATIPNTLDDGSYVELHGTDTSAGRTFTDWKGTAGEPVWIVGIDGSEPIIRGDYELRDCDYVYMEEIDFNGNSTYTEGALKIEGGCSFISIRNSWIRNYDWAHNASGIGIDADLGTGEGYTHDIVIYNNIFDSLGDWQTTEDEDFHGIQPRGEWQNSLETYNVWVLDNTFTRISGNAMQVTAVEDPQYKQYCNHIYAGRNNISQGRQAGLWAKVCQDVIFSQNTIYNMRKHGNSGLGDAFGMQYGADRLWIIFNTVYDCNFFYRQSATLSGADGYNTYLMGNKIWDIEDNDNAFTGEPSDQGTGIVFYAAADYGNLYVIDNTMDDMVQFYGNDSGTDRSVELSGNICGDLKTRTNNAYISDYDSDNLNIDYMLFSNGDEDFFWNGTRYSSYSEWKVATNECTNCPSPADPLFLGTTNFVLQTGSPAINENDSHFTYGLFQSLYGIDIRLGHDEVGRPQGGVYDIGAFEKDTAPPAPFNFRFR